MARWFATAGLAVFVLLYGSCYLADNVTADDADDGRYWIGAMARVHRQFSGKPGTFAHFGDSITVSKAFWTPLADEPRGLSPDGAMALGRVKKYMREECWRDWKGAEFGNEGGMTIRWAHENIDNWLQRLNPEVALIMFGTNDIGQIEPAEYKQKMRDVVQRCLDNGTIVILNTIPPRSGRLPQCREFAEIVRDIGREQKVPVVDYLAEILDRRPDDWDGTLEKFKRLSGDDYQVPTLIARDGVHPTYPRQFAGDYSEEALNNSGYSLRSYLVLKAYGNVIEHVLQPEQ